MILVDTYISAIQKQINIRSYFKEEISN